MTNPILDTHPPTEPDAASRLLKYPRTPHLQPGDSDAEQTPWSALAGASSSSRKSSMVRTAP